MSKPRRHHQQRSQQRARARIGVYLYGSDREGASAPSAFSGGAAGGFVR
ncbi:MAG: hypothetical protein KDK12_09790 [Rhodobacteraceae bacterium]|nr:hypothetical protein [Paracoccaceae bacterium]